MKRWKGVRCPGGKDWCVEVFLPKGIKWTIQMLIARDRERKIKEVKEENR